MKTRAGRMKDEPTGAKREGSGAELSSFRSETPGLLSRSAPGISPATLVKRALLDRGMTQKQLAEKIGMGEGVLSHLLRGRRKNLSERERRAIASALGLPAEAFAAPYAPTSEQRQLRCSLVPGYPVGAGYEIAFGDGDNPVGESLEPPIYTDVPDPNAFAGRIVGTSMEVTQSRAGARADAQSFRGFCEGEIVVFDTKAEVRAGCFCLVRFDDGGTTFKQVFFERQKVRLHPLNPEFRDELRPRSRVRAMYRAVRHIRRI